MKKDSCKITYAVSLHFTEDVSKTIMNTVQEIATIIGISFILDNKIPPHITIGAFHAAKGKENQLLQLVDNFTKRQRAGQITFSALGDFNKKVLFLKPDKNDFLTQLNSDIHKLLLPSFEKGENGYYLPDIWFPHTTLATRLSQIQFQKALDIARKIRLPLKADINEIAVYQCSPFLELERFAMES